MRVLPVVPGKDWRPVRAAIASAGTASRRGRRSAYAPEHESGAQQAQHRAANMTALRRPHPHSPFHLFTRTSLLYATAILLYCISRRETPPATSGSSGRQPSPYRTIEKILLGM